MAESEPQDESCTMNTKQGDSSGKGHKSKFQGKLQDTGKSIDQAINEMKVSELKDSLKRLTVASTGNKNELRIRLRDVLARKNYFEVVAAIRNDTVEGNTDTTDDEEETSESAVASDKDAEDSRKKQLERGHRLERFKYRASWDEGRQRTGTKYERRTQPKGERSEMDETSDSDTSIEQGNNEGDRRSSDTRRRSTHTSSEFTIKDVEGSLTYFTGDDKLSITK